MVSVDPEQTVAPHIWVAGAWAQVPAVALPAVHVPVLPQTLLVTAHAASAPEVTAEHVPSEPVTLHAWQAPAHAELQHTPSTHIRPEPQDPPVTGQECPAIHPVHWWVVVLQPAPFTQSPSTVQDVLQIVPLQLKSPH